MKIANYNKATGELLGWYSPEINGIYIPKVPEKLDEDGNVETKEIPAYYDTSKIPTPNIEVSEEIWSEAVSNGYNFVNNGTLSFKDFRTTYEIFTITKSSKVNEITTSFNKSVEAITTALPHEMVSWRKQEDEARAYTADNTTATPFIDAQLITRDLGETKDELIVKIISNTDAYQVAYATLLGKFQNLTHKISTASDIDELALIKW